MSGVTPEYTDYPMSPWDYIGSSWIGDPDVEMTAPLLRKAKKLLTEGGAVHVRGSIDSIKRYATILQGPSEHEKTTAEGAVLSATIDPSTILPGELHLDPFASRIDRYKKLFVSRTGFVHEKFPTAFAFQFAQSRSSRASSVVDSISSAASDGVSVSANLSQPTVVVDNVPPSTWSWALSVLKRWSNGFTWFGFLRDARHTPVIIVLGNMWKWAWAVPYVQLPLGVVTALWLLSVCNVTWNDLWTGAGAVIVNTVMWIFTLADEFFDHSSYFRGFCFVVLLYAGSMLVGAASIGLWNCIRWSVKKLCSFWTFLPIEPIKKEDIEVVNGCVSLPIVKPSLGSDTDLSDISPLLTKGIYPSAKILPPPIVTKPDSAPISGSALSYSDLDDVMPSDSASTIILNKSPDQSSVDSTAPFALSSSRVCQAHLVKLHPYLNVLSDIVCHGKRIRLVRLLSCDKLWQNGAACLASGDNGVSAVLCGRHREVYMVHRDFFKCLKRECYDMGIELDLDASIIRECKHHLQKRLLHTKSDVAESIKQRMLSSPEQEALPTLADVELKTPEFPSVTPALDLADSFTSSSSDVTMPELVESNGEDSKSSLCIPPAKPDASASFAQSVRSELELLAEKSIAADASQWARQANSLLKRDDAVPTSTKRNGVAVCDGKVLVSGGTKELPPVQTFDSPSSLLPPQTPIVVMSSPMPPVVSPPINTTLLLDSQSSVASVQPVSQILPQAPLQPIIGQASDQMPSQSSQPKISNVIPPSNLDDFEGVEGLMPKFVRRRSAPAAHQVITDEVDAEMYERGPGDVSDLRELASLIKAEKEDNKDEPWTRLNELATFALCGFGQFNAKLAVGVYNKERKATLQRQGLSERDRLWDLGVRVPVGTRIAHSSSTLHWGALSSDGVSDDALLVSDFAPWSQESYDRYQPDPKKNEARRKQALSIEKFAKAGKQHSLMFSLLYGREHYKERADCLLELERLHEARPELFTVDFVSDAFEEMNFHYISQVKEGTRKVIRLGADRVKKPDFARLALNCVDGRGPRWEYPTTFSMRHSAGLWMSRIIPKLEEKVSKAAWLTVLDSKQKEKDRKAGSVPPVNETPVKRMYPAGRPLRSDEQELSKQHRPKSMSSGDYL